jgi:hypothetical protein
MTCRTRIFDIIAEELREATIRQQNSSWGFSIRNNPIAAPLGFE